MRRPWTLCLALSLVPVAACGNSDPCATAPDLPAPGIEFGTGSLHSDFRGIPEGGGMTLVIGQQHSAMFDDVALRASGVVVPPEGMTKHGYELRVSMEGEEIGRAKGRAFVRGGEAGTMEVVDIRVIPERTALELWDHDVVFEAEVTGACGRVATAVATFRAVRLGEP